MKKKQNKKNNQKDYTKTMSIARNCQNGVRLARPTNPLFFEGQSVEVSGGCFFGVGSLSEFLGSVFFLFFFAVFFFDFFREKNKQKTKQKNRKKKGSPPDRGAPGRQPPNPPSLCIGEIWCLLKPYFAIYKSTQSSAAPCFFHLFFLVFPFVFIFILFFPFVFMFILFFPFVFIFILFFLICFFCVFFCFFFYLFWISSKLELWFS